MNSDKDGICLPYKLEISKVPYAYLYFVGGVSNLGFLDCHALFKSFMLIGGFSNDGQPEAFQMIYISL